METGAASGNKGSKNTEAGVKEKVHSSQFRSS
jgi:hypothetical protein